MLVFGIEWRLMSSRLLSMYSNIHHQRDVLIDYLSLPWRLQYNISPMTVQFNTWAECIYIYTSKYMYDLYFDRLIGKLQQTIQMT